MDEKEEKTVVHEPVQEQATNDASEAVEEIKNEVDTRDDKILEELRAIHEAINAQTEHHIRHLESHTLSQSAPVQDVATNVANETLPDEPVSLEISEPKDMPKEESKEHRKSRKFGKKGRRA